MSWFYWPEFIILTICLILVLFGIYYVIRKVSGLSKRISNLENKMNTIKKND